MEALAGRGRRASFKCFIARHRLEMSSGSLKQNTIIVTLKRPSRIPGRGEISLKSQRRSEVESEIIENGLHHASSQAGRAGK